MNLKFFILLFFISINFISAEELPETIPADLSIQYFQSLGHAGHGFSMEISEKKCNYADKFINNSNEFNFNLSKEEFTQVYQVLRKNSVHKITTANEMIHDYDGLSISIQWGNNSIQISQSGSKISSRWEKEWNNIISLLEKIRAREIEKAVKAIEIQLDKSLVGKFLHVQANTMGVVFRDYIDNNTIQKQLIQIKLIPGNHKIYSILYEGYDPKKLEEAKANSMYPDNALNPYLESLKTNSATLTIDTTKKTSFKIVLKDKKLAIE